MQQITFDRSSPYNELPDLSPSLSAIESVPVYRALTAATEAIGFLNGLVQTTTSKIYLAKLLPVIEAQASSAIEGIVTTVSQLIESRDEPENNIDPMTKEAQYYLEALLSSLPPNDQRPVSFGLARKICAMVKNRPEIDVRSRQGTVILEEVSKQPRYTPPEGKERLLKLVGRWEKFVNDESSLHPLIALALAHYQFEAIHPFADGNGRTGRILNIVILIKKGIIDAPVIYPSQVLLKEKRIYCDLLRDVTERANWEGWVVFFLESLAQSAQQSAAKVIRVERCRIELEKVVKNQAPKFPATDLVHQIFQFPWCDVEQLQTAGLGNYKTCRKYLETLVSLGVLKSRLKRRRKTYLNAPFMSTLMDEEFNANAYLRAYRQFYPSR